MEKDESTNIVEKQQKDGKKIVYQKPEVLDLGKMQELTAGSLNEPMTMGFTVI